ncbi:MAG: hypothetical protein ACI4WG_07075, partial [Erysipelotrichaceae bacterium]
QPSVYLRVTPETVKLRKLAETEEDLLQHRTDGTDAFDILYIGCEKFPFKELMPYTASGVL